MLKSKIKFITAFNIIFLFFSAFQSTTKAEPRFDIRKQKLHTILVDTAKDKMFVYEVRNAIIFFRQSDVVSILATIEKGSAHLPGPFYKLRDTLNSGQKAIRVKDVMYTFDQRERDSILVFEKPNPLGMELDNVFYFIGASLLLEGKFMLYSKSTNKIVNRHLIAKKRKGIMGGADLLFFLPDGKIFYNMIISLGD